MKYLPLLILLMGCEIPTTTITTQQFLDNSEGCFALASGGTPCHIYDENLNRIFILQKVNE